MWGAKNSALKLMAAALLAVGRTRLTNVPAILDVTIMAELLRRLGCTVDYDAPAGVVEIDVPAQIGHRADYDLVRALRASTAVLGPLVARCWGRGRRDPRRRRHRLARPRPACRRAGGPGRQRPRDARLPRGRGARRAATGPRSSSSSRASAPPRTSSPLPSWRGERTRLENAAREPEIVDLAEMLISMGARISGAGWSVIEIEGVAALLPIEHAVVPDRIAAGTWAFAAAATRGDIEVVGGRARRTSARRSSWSGPAGPRSTTTDRGLPGRLRRSPAAAFDVATLPYPGFPTDLQPFALACNAVADGSAMITENLFEARFRTVQELNRLGAETRIDGHHVMVHGVERLSGAPVEASDIRAGAALVIAGLVADGVTTVERGPAHRPRVCRVRREPAGARRGRHARARRRPALPSESSSRRGPLSDLDQTVDNPNPHPARPCE